MSRKSKAAVIGSVIAAVFLGGTGMALADDGFTYYDFKCPGIGIERHKETLTTTVVRGGKTITVKYVCDMRGCFNMERFSNDKGEGVQFRHIYFPEGRTEFVFSTAVWVGDEETPKVTESRTVPLVTCKPQ